MKTERKKIALPLSLGTQGQWHMHDLSFADCLLGKADTVPSGDENNYSLSLSTEHKFVPV